MEPSTLPDNVYASILTYLSDESVQHLALSTRGDNTAINRTEQYGYYWLQRIELLVGPITANTQHMDLKKVYANLVDSLSLSEQTSWGHLDEVIILLNTGADPTDNDNDALIEAAIGDGLDILELFLNHKSVTPNDVNEMLISAVTYKGNLDHVEMLLEHGADTTYSDNKAYREAIHKGRIDMLRLFIEHDGAIPDQARHDMLIMAAKRGDEDIVEMLINQSPNLVRGNREALISAVKGPILTASSKPHNKHYNIVKLLLELGGYAPDDINAAFAEAATGHNLDVLKILIEHGADPTLNNSRALVRASVYGTSDTVKLILAHGEHSAQAVGTALITAIGRGQFKMIKELLEYMKLPQEAINKAFMAAINANAVETVTLLLEEGANPNYRQGAAIGTTSSKGKVELVRLLLKYGAYAKGNGNDAIMLASEHGHYQIVEMLLKAGADPKALDGYPLKKAIKNGHVQVARLLREYGA